MNFHGFTIKGAGRGKEIGFPTVNVQILSPDYEEGVFAVRGELNGEKFEGVAHFGPRPTFGDEKLSVEIHIFDFANAEIQEGTNLHFGIHGRKLRGILKFKSVKELVQQIQKDISEAKKILRKSD